MNPPFRLLYLLVAMLFATEASASNLLVSVYTQSFTLAASTTVTLADSSGIQFSSGTYAGVPVAQISVVGPTTATCTVTGVTCTVAATAGSANSTNIGFQTYGVTWSVTLAVLGSVAANGRGEQHAIGHRQGVDDPQ